MGKPTERWKTIQEQKDKTFSQELTNRKKCSKKLKQFKEERTGNSSSEEEHKVNALASGAEEGRDKLR